jgi:uncharacterized coiled-coil protein SlyX
MILDESKKTVTNPGRFMFMNLEDNGNAKAFQKLLNKGLEANANFRRSVESLDKEGITQSAVCNIFKSQAELNKINTAWNSVASISLTLGQQKIGALERTVNDQGREIEGLQRGLQVHRMVIERLCMGFGRLSSKYEALRKNNERSTALLKIIHSEIVLLKTKALSAQSFWNSVLNGVDMALKGTLKYGLMVIMCDALVKISQLMKIAEVVISALGLQKAAAIRIHSAARVTAVAGILLLLRSRINKLLSILKWLVLSISENTI